mmetsp:Transcript_53236/g.140868  ORF Transcript_53236/g.140868 Transcript_53236/m.140868 type:complete len:207 (+) Transcript_53236:1594-2214(+)
MSQNWSNHCSLQTNQPCTQCTHSPLPWKKSLQSTPRTMQSCLRRYWTHTFQTRIQCIHLPLPWRRFLEHTPSTTQSSSHRLLSSMLRQRIGDTVWIRCWSHTSRPYRRCMYSHLCPSRMFPPSTPRTRSLQPWRSCQLCRPGTTKSCWLRCQSHTSQRRTLRRCSLLRWRKFLLCTPCMTRRSLHLRRLAVCIGWVSVTKENRMPK